MKRIFVTEQGGKAAREYKYAGGDTSYLYKYVLSPTAEFFVTLTPRWVAPNVITATGLLLIIIAHLTAAFTDPNMEGVQPAWQFVLSGVTLWAYSTMDNMDGKQARRTGSGSSLGLLFDHGCDAINAGVLSATTFCCALSTGNTWYAYLVWTAIITAFFFATWEEYHLNVFILPVINGPSEGLTATVILYLSTAYFGSEWTTWMLPVSFVQITWFQFAMFLAAVPSLATCFYQLYNVYAHQKEKQASFTPALKRLIPLVMINGAGWVWIFASDSVMRDHYRTMFLILGCVFSDSVMKLMLAHVCKQPYTPSYALLAMLWLGPLNGVLQILPEGPMMMVMLAITASNLVFFCVKCAKELMHDLDVNCFTIKEKK